MDGEGGWEETLTSCQPSQGKNTVNKGPYTEDSTQQEVPCGDCCPICLKQIPSKDVSDVPGCGHSYCEEKDFALCPVCKRRFETVLTFRNLDGTFRDFKAEESICLVKRTTWYLRRSKGCHLPLPLSDNGRYDEEWDDDYLWSNDIDDTEDYYFSNAAGSARIVLANRRFGKNGFIRGGRAYAQSTGDSSGEKNGSIGVPVVKKSEGTKTNTKGKKALRREKKKQEEANRIK